MKPKTRENAARDQIKCKYGLTAEQHEGLWRTQGMKCANVHCQVATVNKHGLCVDHDHATGEVRGLLCRKCNVAIGLARDDVKRLRGLVEYLKSPPGASVITLPLTPKRMAA